MVKEVKLRRIIKKEGIDSAIQKTDTPEFKVIRLKQRVENSSAWRSHAEHCAVSRIVSLGIGGKPVPLVEEDSKFFDSIARQRSLEETGLVNEVDEEAEEAVVENPGEEMQQGEQSKQHSQSALYGTGAAQRHNHDLYGVNRAVVGCGCGANINVEIESEASGGSSQSPSQSTGSYSASQGSTMGSDTRSMYATNPEERDKKKNLYVK